MSTWGHYYWPVFLIVSAVWLMLGFGIPEGLAIASQPSSHLDNTLSFYARTELHASVATDMSIHTLAWWLTLLLWAMFIGFITPHIWFLQFG